MLLKIKSHLYKYFVSVLCACVYGSIHKYTFSQIYYFPVTDLSWLSVEYIVTAPFACLSPKPCNWSLEWPSGALS